VVVVSPDPPVRAFPEYAKAIMFGEVRPLSDSLIYRPRIVRVPAEAPDTVSEEMRPLLERYNASITGEEEFIMLLRTGGGDRQLVTHLPERSQPLISPQFPLLSRLYLSGSGLSAQRTHNQGGSIL